MNKLFKEIFEHVISHEIKGKEMDKRVNKEINTLVIPYNMQLKETELEELKNLMYATALTAEQEGFQLGMEYAIKILISVLLD
jgi:predicted nucleic acid-binding protein